MKAKLILIRRFFFFENPKNQIPNAKNCHFSAPPISNLPFLQFKACKSGKIDTISQVAQEMKLLGCPAKGHFTSKSGKNIYLFFKPGFLSII